MGHAEELEFDELLDKIGNFGRYQKWTRFVLCLTLPAHAYTIMATIFLNAKPNFYCSSVDSAYAPYNLTFEVGR